MVGGLYATHHSCEEMMYVVETNVYKLRIMDGKVSTALTMIMPIHAVSFFQSLRCNVLFTLLRHISLGVLVYDCIHV